MQRGGEGTADRWPALARVAWLLLAIWCLTGAAYGAVHFLSTASAVRAISHPGPWANPIPAEFSFTLWLLWLLTTANLAPAGLITGVVHLVRRRMGRRAVLLVAMVVGAAAVQVVAGGLVRDNGLPSSFIHDGRLTALLVAAAAVTVAVGSFTLLGRASAGRPAAGRALLGLGG